MYLSSLGVVLLALHPAAQRPSPGQLPPLPLTQLDERIRSPELDNRRLNLTFAQPVPIRELLVLLVRGSELSVVLDPDAGGTFIGELRNVTVRQGLELALRPLNLDYSVDGALIRVFRTTVATRVYDVNYLAVTRTGTTSVGGSDEAGGSVRVETRTNGDLFEDLERGVRMLVSDRGQVHVDRKAGLLQVTDVPDRLDRVGIYLETVHDRVHRQVQIDARIVEIELADPEAESLDWTRLSGFTSARTGRSVTPPPNGVRIDSPSRFLAALSQQGRVSLLASPRLVAMNNELAIVRASSAPTRASRADTRPQSLTLGVIPQIAADGVVMLSISPIVTLADRRSDESAIAIATRASDTVARVAAGETIVISGFGRHRVARESRGGGWFRRPTAVTRHVELLIMLTPTIVGPPGAG